MPQPTAGNPTWQDFQHALYHKPRRWLAPAVVVCLVGCGFALLKPAVWEASQAMVVRDEAIGSNGRPGRFVHQDDRKTVQETLVELAKSRPVLEAALRLVGPASTAAKPSSDPSPSAIETLRRSIAVAAPKGAEFGHTEVLYLSVRDGDKQRAVQLAAALFRELDQRVRALRSQRAQSLVDELTETVQLAEGNLQAATERVSEIEKSVGSDLTDLRNLHDATSGDSGLRRWLVELDNELRQARNNDRILGELYELLVVAQDRPASLVATPNKLLESQPALRRLKDGLVDAQLATSRLAGSRTEQHPSVISARLAEQQVRHDLHLELESALGGIEVERRSEQNRMVALEAQATKLRQRSEKLAAVRAEYQNRTAAAQHYSEILRSARQHLADAQGTYAAAQSTSLLAVWDQPRTGQYPLGPGRLTVALTGAMGGLLLGLGIVFVSVQPQSTHRPLTKSSNLHGGGSFSEAPNRCEPMATGRAFRDALQRLSNGYAGLN